MKDNNKHRFEMSIPEAQWKMLEKKAEKAKKKSVQDFLRSKIDRMCK